MNSCPLIPAEWDLPAVLRIRLGHGPGRQRVLEADGHLLLVLHEVPKHHQSELNVLAAFFFPLATLSAVLGANLQNVFPEMSQKSALAVMLIVGLLLGSGLTYLITRPAKRPQVERE